MFKALFLDRDDTLVKDSGYLCDPKKVELLPGVSEGLKIAKESGYKLFLFSNQSGVGRGFFTIEKANACTARMLELIGLGDDLFQDICLATEVPTETPIYRKPSPRFILEMIKKYALDPLKCWIIGDKITDVQAGINACINSILLTSKHSITLMDKQFLKHHKVLLAENLLAAVQEIVAVI